MDLSPARKKVSAHPRNCETAQAALNPLRVSRDFPELTVGFGLSSGQGQSATRSCLLKNAEPDGMSWIYKKKQK